MLLRAGAAAFVVMLALGLFGAVGAIVVGSVTLVWLAYLSVADRALVTAVALRMHEFELTSVVRTRVPHAEIQVRDGYVARVDRRLRTHDHVPLTAGSRVVQLLLMDDATRYAWMDDAVSLALDSTEALGAIDVVLAGDNLIIDVLVGGQAGDRPEPLAIHLQSTAGSVISYDPIVRPVFARPPSSALELAD